MRRASVRHELLLAQALGDAGHTEESYNYFLGLWETQPGSGFINLRLARLAAKKNDMQAAINYYRAAIYGIFEELTHQDGLYLPSMEELHEESNLRLEDALQPVTVPVLQGSETIADAVKSLAQYEDSNTAHGAYPLQ
jgi:hypothetical protein